MNFEVGDKINIPASVRCGGCVAEIRDFGGPDRRWFLETSKCNRGRGPHFLDRRDLEKCSIKTKGEDFRLI